MKMTKLDRDALRELQYCLRVCAARQTSAWISVATVLRVANAAAYRLVTPSRIDRLSQLGMIVCGNSNGCGPTIFFDR